MPKAVNCKICGGTVSTDASCCPHCGGLDFRPKVQCDACHGTGRERFERHESIYGWETDSMRHIYDKPLIKPEGIFSSRTCRKCSGSGRMLIGDNRTMPWIKL